MPLRGPTYKSGACRNSNEVEFPSWTECGKHCQSVIYYSYQGTIYNNCQAMIYNNFQCIINNKVKVCNIKQQSDRGYFLTISSYLWLSWVIIGYIQLSLAINDYLWLSLAINGSLWIPWGICAYLRLYWPILGFPWL